MSTPQLPDPEWVDFGDDIERFGREAQEIWNRTHPSHPTPWVIFNRHDQPPPNGPSNPLGPGPGPHIPPATFDAPYPDLEQLSIAQFVGGSTMLTPIMSPDLIEFPSGISTDQVPAVFSLGALWDHYPSVLLQTPRLGTVPLPPVDAGYDDGSHFGGNSNDDDGNDNFPGSAPGEGQWTLEWLDTLSHQGVVNLEIEDNGQSEQSRGPDPSSSKAGFNRVQNEGEKKRCLAQIREALGIPPKESELLTLQEAINYLGGTVPKREESSAWLPKPQRQAKKLAELRECFDVLKDLVGPQTTKQHDLKVLKNVLARVTAQVGAAQSSEGSYQPYGVFRAW